MLLRALIAFVALPGIFAFLVPATIAMNTHQPSQVGVPALFAFAVGVLALLWCVLAFYVTGKGTLAPWAPPARLVTVGLYRFTRNPMYLAVLLVLAGWALAFQSLVLAGYAALVAVAFHLRVVLGEEPWLARTHGVQWQEYSQAVPRWLGLRYLHDAQRRDA